MFVFPIPIQFLTKLSEPVNVPVLTKARHSAHLFVKTSDVHSQTNKNQNTGPDPKTHIVEAESGNQMERTWCDNCGCGLWIRNVTKTPEMTNLKAGESGLFT